MLPPSLLNWEKIINRLKDMIVYTTIFAAHNIYILNHLNTAIYNFAILSWFDWLNAEWANSNDYNDTEYNAYPCLTNDNGIIKFCIDTPALSCNAMSMTAEFCSINWLNFTATEIISQICKASNKINFAFLDFKLGWWWPYSIVCLYNTDEP